MAPKRGLASEVCLGSYTTYFLTERYARKYFATVDPDLLNECQEALALLAFSVTTTCLKYKVCRRSLSLS